jgi:hypothetical protein
MFVLGAGLTLAACSRTEQAPEPLPVTVDSMRAQVRALERQKGEDAYTDPAVEGVLRQLDSLAAAGGAQAEDAQRYSRYLWAKKRLALKAQEGGREPDESVILEGSRGPRQMTGEVPTNPGAVKRAEQVKVGTSRQELLQAFGSCLERATWFQGNGRGPTTEFFHITPPCRERLGARIFTVANEQVTRLSPGNLDRLMRADTAARREEESGGEEPH